MNKIKSLFIGIFPMISMAIAGYGIYQLIEFEINYIWLGAILTSLPITLFFSRVMILKDLPRTSSHLSTLSTLAVIGITLSTISYLQLTVSSEEMEASKIALVSSAVGFICYLLYLFWYSSLGRSESQQLRLGQKIPLFSVLNTEGVDISSSSFEGSPTVFIFFRGNWCPLCMAQIKEVATKYKELSALGAKVALIAPQTEKHTQELAAKFNVPFLFLTDVSNKAATTLGLVMKNGLPTGMEILGYDKDTVYPTVIITDDKGIIIYSDFTNNYRIRPEPEEFIDVLKTNVRLSSA